MTLATSDLRTDSTCRHFRALATAMVRETDVLCSAGVPVAHLMADMAGLPAAIDRCESVGEVIESYRQRRGRLAGALDDAYVLAARYPSMSDFWRDAVAQERAQRLTTYWDSYEHGLRRLLERELASAYRSDEVVLVNSGMSAVDVALRSVGLRPGDTLLAHHRAYFETDQYLTLVLADTGVRVLQADLTDREAIRMAIAERPAVALIEPVLNGPTCDVPVFEAVQAAGCPIVVDNSVLSHAMPAAVLNRCGSPVLVVESGSKYLCRQASSGVLYGWGDWGAKARLTARRTGQQLQGRALHRLRVGEIAHCADRLVLHARRAAVFRQVLIEEAPWLTVSDAAAGLDARDDLLASHVRGGARGCLLFVSLPVAEREAEEAHRAAVARWSASHGPRVQAGFGWTATTGRAYGPDSLNTAAGRCFVRISVGLEPENDVRDLAMGFVAAARAAMGEHWTTGRADAT